METFLELISINVSVGEFAGQAVTVGLIASFLFQFIKWVNKYLVPRIEWMGEWKFSPFQARTIVAVLATLLNLYGAWMLAVPLTAAFVIQTFIAYLTAVTTHDHLSKRAKLISPPS